MQNNYAFIGLLLVIGVAFCAIAMWLSWALRPTHKPVGAKRETYECGEIPFGDAWKQFRVGYYIFALVFIIFDVEAVFIFPWAAVLKSLKPVQIGHMSMATFAFVEMMVFIAILLIGLIYAWWKGVLRWE